MQILVAALIAVLVFLQYLLWIAEDGVRQTHALRIAIQAQIQENAELNERNQAMEADIKDLKSGLVAIEERARSEMGMIRRDETFYRILDQAPKPVVTLGSPALAGHKPSVTAKPSVATGQAPATTAKPPAQAVKPPAAITKPSPPQPIKPPVATIKSPPNQPTRPVSSAPGPPRPAGSPSDPARPH